MARRGNPQRFAVDDDRALAFAGRYRNGYGHKCTPLCPSGTVFCARKVQLEIDFCVGEGYTIYRNVSVW